MSEKKSRAPVVADIRENLGEKDKNYYKPENVVHSRFGSTEYSPSVCDIIIKMRADGFTINEVCAKLKISDQTYRNWKKRYPEFQEANEIGIKAFKAHYVQKTRENLYRDKNDAMQFDAKLHMWMCEKLVFREKKANINLTVNEDAKMSDEVKNQLEELKKINEKPY